MILEYTLIFPSSQSNNKFPAASPRNTTLQCKIFLFVEALLVLAVLEVLALPALKDLLAADVVEDGPMVVCETGTTGVVEMGVVETGVVETGVVDGGVPVLIVRDGRPATDEHVSSKARMKMHE